MSTTPVFSSVDTSPEALYRRYSAGLNLTDISNIVGFSRVVVGRKLRRFAPGYSAESRRFNLENRRLMLAYIKTQSLRAVARDANIGRTALSDRFQKMHPDYVEITRRGVFASTGDWLRSHKARFRPKEVDRVEQWLLSELPSLLESEAETNVLTISNAGERKLREHRYLSYDDDTNAYMSA